MTTWRERVQLARERGGDFPQADYELWLNITTCPAAEAVRNATGDLTAQDRVRFAYAWTIGNTFGHPMVCGRPDACDRILDEIEDVVLCIKRWEPA